MTASRICELFDVRAAQQPDALAVVCGGRSLTYGQLDRWSASLAARLVAEGARPEALIAVWAERSLETVVALLAIARSGAAYLPLEPTYPAARLEFMLADSAAELLVARSSAEPVVDVPGVKQIAVDDSETAGESGDYRGCPASGSNLAYAIYTSGSTGQPKGVLIEHAAASNTLCDINERFRVTPADRVLCLSSFGFDLSVYDVFGVLGAGGVVILPDEQQWRDPAAWIRLMAEHGVTLWNTVPALMEMLVTRLETMDHPAPDTLRLALLSGDWIPVTLPERIRRQWPAASVISLGGATEASIWSIAWPIERVDPHWKSIPYGLALKNQSVHVFDEALVPCATGKIGELYIGGVGVARGYLNRPELTAGRFITDPLSPAPGSRLYRTGDLGRRNADGVIELLGRADEQVKLCGNRVELGEIECVLAKHPAVREAVVVAPRDDRDKRQLGALVVLVGGASVTTCDLQSFLAQRLPRYMIPACVKFVPAIPLSANGKVDRRAAEQALLATAASTCGHGSAVRTSADCPGPLRSGVDVHPSANQTQTAQANSVVSPPPRVGKLSAPARERNSYRRETERTESMTEQSALLPDQSGQHQTPIIITGATEQERRQFHQWNQTVTDYPRDATIPQLFEEQVRERPDAPALLMIDTVWTYAQLDMAANEIAKRLRAAGVKEGAAIGVSLERSPELIASLLAILKVGAVYVPLDRQYPVGRLEFMVLDANVRLVITSSADPASGVAWKAPVLDLNSAAPVSASWTGRRPKGPVSAQSPAYVLYTSGSTGQPKGVVVPHRAIVRLVKNTNYMEFSPSDVFLQLGPVSFDAATLEIWGPLLNGGRLVIPPLGPPTLSELAKLVLDMEVTTLWLTAGLFHQVVDDGLENYRGLRYLLAGGDVLSPDHVRTALRELPTTTIINGYGPTENTTFTTCHVMRDVADLGDGPTPIGRPVSNTQVYIFDSQLQPTPIGVTGELYCGGDGLALGYVNRPELNEQSFIQWTPAEAGAAPIRLYKTGDLAQWRPDGTIQFCGRADHQVKIRGHRIEIAEVEAALRQHPAVRQVAVAPVVDSGRHKHLTAFLEIGDRAPIAAEELRTFLARSLPSYMIPGHFVCLDRLPLDCNGKVNRTALLNLPRPVAVPQAPQRPTSHDTVEKKLATIWQAVLDLEAIGPDDDFFVLGGDSLLAVALLAQVERELGVALPVVELVQNPTIAGLAKLLRESQTTERAIAAVEIQAGAPDRPTMFFAPCLHGNLMTIRALASRLDPDQPVYALTPTGVDGQAAPHASIDELTEHYLAQVRDVQPQGPYILSGYSLGGVVAHEMARRLTEAGQTVSLLILIDAPACGRPPLVHKANETYKRLVHRSRNALARLRRRAGPALPVNADMIKVHREAFNSWQPKPYHGPTVIVRAMTPPHPIKRWLDRNPQEWRGRGLVDPGTSILWTPGNHETIFAKPNVDIMARQIQQELDRALHPAGAVLTH